MLLALFRLVYFVIYTVIRVSQIVLASVLFGINHRRSLLIRQSWARHLYPVIGIQLEVRGTPPDFPCIIMGNHHSYLDPAVVVVSVLGFPVSKAEVENWPVIGYGAKVSGVLYLKRESRDSRKKTLLGIGERVREGWPVILYPEGTTYDTVETGPFRIGGFRLAANEGIPIVPVATDYKQKEAYWINDDSFMKHFMQLFSKPRINVCVHYGPTFTNTNADQLMKDTKDWLDARLKEIRVHLDSEVK